MNVKILIATAVLALPGSAFSVRGAEDSTDLTTLKNLRDSAGVVGLLDSKQSESEFHRPRPFVGQNESGL